MYKTKTLSSAVIVACLLLASLVACSVASDGEVYITGVTPVPSIRVDWLVPYANVIAMLPPTTTISLSNGSLATVALNWISITDPIYPEFSYNPYSSGTYVATATFELPEGVSQPDPPIPLQVKTTVTQMTALLPGLYPDVTRLTLDFPGFNQPGTYVADWMILDGFNRTYYYYIPSSYDGCKPVPLVVTLHGGGSCGLAELLGGDDCAEKYGYILVCPDYSTTYVKDFVSAIIDKMAANYNIDTRRVYACGISMGGMATTILAFELADKIAAVGIVSGSREMVTRLTAGQKLPRPMTVVITAGTGERIFGSPIYEHLRARAAVPLLVQQLQCNPEPEVTFWPATVDDRTNVTRYVYSGGIYGTQVIYYEVGEGAHAWPGGLQYAIPSSLGWVTTHVEAHEELWEIFKKYSIPEVFEGNVTIKTPSLNYEGPAELHISAYTPYEHTVYLRFDDQWIEWNINFKLKFCNMELYNCKGELGKLLVTVVRTKDKGSYAVAVGPKVFFCGSAP